MKSKVIIRSVTNECLSTAVGEILDLCGWKSIISKGANVVIKPNLNTAEKEKVPSANTDPRLIAALCEILKTRTDNIIIGESDGARFAAEEAFEATDVFKIVKKYGVKLISFSKEKTKIVDDPLLNGFGLPEPLLDADVVITLPVIKTHALTVFTGAIKNQMGCIPRYDRVLLHKHLDQLLANLNHIIQPRLAVMDGIIGVEGRGPTNGKPRRLDLLLGSRDLVALDSTAMRLIGLDPYSAKHVVLASEKGLGAIDQGQILIDGDFERYRTDFEPAVLDWAVKYMNYLTRYKWFTNYIPLNDSLFYPTKWLVDRLRDVDIVR